ncbi:uncharacterized protein [Euphorbia lathyris]|uniref:uncharacterized protein isoform X2 n=1 Tax=Euphorbia lathyris TaxID=212925 RepID=UPI003313DB9A
MKVILTPASPLAVAPPARSTFFKFSDGRFFLSVCPHSPALLPPRLDCRLGAKRHNNPKLVFVTRAADSTQPSAVSTSSEKATVPDDEFSLAKVSFGVIGLGLGVSLLSYGFGAYFNILPGSEWSAIMLTYGFPLAIIGMALKYAELKPVQCLTYADAQVLRETSATPILKQVRSDVTRYRYGDEQHLEEALKRIFQYGLDSLFIMKVLQQSSLLALKEQGPLITFHETDEKVKMIV